MYPVRADWLVLYVFFVAFTTVEKYSGVTKTIQLQSYRLTVTIAVSSVRIVRTVRETGACNILYWYMHTCQSCNSADEYCQYDTVINTTFITVNIIQ